MKVRASDRGPRRRSMECQINCYFVTATAGNYCYYYFCNVRYCWVRWVMHGKLTVNCARFEKNTNEPSKKTTRNNKLAETVTVIWATALPYNLSDTWNYMQFCATLLEPCHYFLLFVLSFQKKKYISWNDISNTNPTHLPTSSTDKGTQVCVYLWFSSNFDML